MAELNKVKHSLGQGGFSSAVIYPDMDVEAIAKKLKVEQEGKARGEKNLPNSDDKNQDDFEKRIVSNLSEFRRLGLSKYEDRRNAYRLRLNEIQLKYIELSIFAKKLETDYEKEIKVSENKFANEIDQVRNHSNEIEEFKRRNKIWRTPSERNPLGFTLGFVAALFVVEFFISTYFFTLENERALAFSAIIACLISTVNIGISITWGWFSRNIIHVNYFRKLVGLICLVGFFVTSAAINLSAAHFSDFLKTLAWTDAIVSGIEHLKSGPFSLERIESWLIFIVGFLVSFVSFLKAWSIDDRYPGYGKAYRRWEKSGAKYAEAIESTISDLTQMRDDVIEELKLGRVSVLEDISSVNGILSSISVLSSNLTKFLEHMNDSINQVLTKYRSANKAARSKSPPNYFKVAYKFDSYVALESNEVFDKSQLEEHVAKMNAIIDASVDNIFDSFNKSVVRVLGSRGRLI